MLERCKDEGVPGLVFLQPVRVLTSKFHGTEENLDPFVTRSYEEILKNIRGMDPAYSIHDLTTVFNTPGQRNGSWIAFISRIRGIVQWPMQCIRSCWMPYASEPVSHNGLITTEQRASRGLEFLKSPHFKMKLTELKESIPESQPVKSISRRVFWSLVVALGIGWIPAFLGIGVVGHVSGLSELGAGTSPYFQASEAWLLYVITPLVVASSFLVYLSPGAILVLVFGQARCVPVWLLLSFISSLALSIFLGTTVKLTLGSPLTFSMLMYLLVGSTVVALLLLGLRLRRGFTLPWPIAQSSDVRRLLWMLAACLVAVAALVPKIFWENFNIDGIEAFEFGRSLTSHILPSWELQDGVFGFYHNFVLFAYPNHWFITLFGPFEAAARLPFILYLVLLFAVLTLLIEVGTSRALSWKEELILWLGLGLYAVVQSYNTNYEPFFADLAEMAATDTLFVLLFTSACYLLWTGRFKWFCAAALMTCLASPGGLLLLVGLAIATFLARPQDWRSHMKAVCGVILVWALAGVGFEIFYNQLYLGGVNNQFSAKNMLRRLYPPTLGEFVRFNALLFPSGLLPALSLVAIRRKDSVGWMIAVVTVVYFVTLYLQAWTALHQFTPIMILPLIVFWRVYLGASQRMRQFLAPAVAVSTVIALILSLPTHFQINQAIRQFGQATEYKIGDYEQSYERAVRGGRSLYALVPEDYRMKYPEQPWGADHLSWIYYATRPKAPGTIINYTIQQNDDPPPPASTLIATKDGVSVYVRDFEAWRRDREPAIPRVAVSPIYEPILRRTYQFFRAYVESTERKAEAGGV